MAKTILNAKPQTLLEKIQELQAAEPTLESLKSHPTLQGATSSPIVTPNTAITPTSGGIDAGGAMAAAQVVAGLLGGIMQSKAATKERKSKAESEKGQRSGEIAFKGAQLKNAALESLMRKL